MGQVQGIFWRQRQQGLVYKLAVVGEGKRGDSQVFSLSDSKNDEPFAEPKMTLEGIDSKNRWAHTSV